MCVFLMDITFLNNFWDSTGFGGFFINFLVLHGKKHTKVSVPRNAQGLCFTLPVTHSALKRIKQKSDNVKCRIKCRHYFNSCCQKSNGHSSHRASPMQIPYINIYRKHTGNNLCWHGNPLLQRRLRPNESQPGIPFSALLRRQPSSESRVLISTEMQQAERLQKILQQRGVTKMLQLELLLLKQSHYRCSTMRSALK